MLTGVSPPRVDRCVVSLLTDMGRYQVVEDPVVGGVRSLLVIPQATDSDFGLYNCTFTNAYGSDSAAIILQKQSKYHYCSHI